MLWQIYFWLLLFLLLAPLPIKLANLWRGKDDSPTSARVEELLNTGILGIGLIGLHGYLNEKECSAPLLWQAWIAGVVLLSLLPLFWSAKLRYASRTIGKRKTMLAAAASTVMFLPLLIAIYRYSIQ